MNISNKLTVFRIILVPFVVFMLLCPLVPHRFLYAFLIFLVASYTDRLDGKLARKYGFITNFGKIMDPLADKILVVSAFVCFVELGLMPAWAAVIIICRELIITSVRFLILENRGKVVSANSWGKIKTVSQIFMILFILAVKSFGEFFASDLFLNSAVYAVKNALIGISVVFSVLSGLIYIRDNFDFIKAN